MIEFLLYVDCAKPQDEQSLKKMAESRAALYYEIKKMNKINSAQSSPMELLFITSELKTLEWWISGLRLNPLFFLISRLNKACSHLIFNLQIN